MSSQLRSPTEARRPCHRYRSLSPVGYLLNPKTRTPAPTMRIPTHSRTDGRSLRKRNANTATSSRLSLSTGATFDAAPIFRARKEHTQGAPVANPESTRKSHVLDESWKGLFHFLVTCTNTMSTAMITKVRTRVARSESTP